jgi:hypothetical protein
MDNNWFISRPPLNKKHFIKDLHDGLWIVTQTLISPVSHVELCYPSHLFILVGEKVSFYRYIPGTQIISKNIALYLMISDTKSSHHVAILSLAFQSKDREASVLDTVDSCIGLDHWPVLIANILKVY